MQSDISVSIRLLGCPQVVAQHDSSVSPSRGLCLLALLSLTPAKRLRRIQFAAQFWDSFDTADRLGNMRQTLLRTLGRHRFVPGRVPGPIAGNPDG